MRESLTAKRVKLKEIELQFKMASAVAGNADIPDHIKYLIDELKLAYDKLERNEDE